MGIFLCPNGVWAHRCTSSNRKLSICAFHQMQILPPEERNRTINKYGTLINNVCAEVFREVYWCLQPILKLIFFFAVVGLELRASTLTQSANPFLWRVFWDRVSWNYLPGWLWTSIILISASWVARMTGMSHRCLTAFLILKSYSPYPFCRDFLQGGRAGRQLSVRLSTGANLTLQVDIKETPGAEFCRGVAPVRRGTVHCPGHLPLTWCLQGLLHTCSPQFLPCGQ
jgi:hypothetical protein